MLDDLVNCIELLQNRIQQHRGMLRDNEIRTRMALIDPMLCALNWDVSDPDVVIPEYNVNGSRADYALLGPETRPAVTVEAKKLDADLTSHLMQMLNYANASGISYAALTDGNHWELYDVFKQAPLETRRMLKVSIAETPAHECAIKLLLLWRSNLSSGQVPTYPIQPIDFKYPPTSTQLPDPERPPDPNWVALPEYDLSIKLPPKAIRFWDEQEQPIMRWNNLLRLTIKKLYLDKRLTVDNLPVKLTSKISVVHSEPTHPTGRPFHSKKNRLDETPFFVNTDFDRTDMVKVTIMILREFQINPANVKLRM